MTPNNSFHQPMLVDAYHHSRFKGAYYLIGFVVKLDETKAPYWAITLSDASGELTVYCRDQSCIFGELLPQSLVNIEIQIDNTGKRPYFRCKFIEAITTPELGFRHVLQLPSILCPLDDVLHRFINLITEIQTPYLTDFLNNVLTQPHVGVKFISCPASINHHHNYAGGLLEHSVEVAEQFAWDKSRSQEERDLAIVAALLHDIGKTQTFTSDVTRTAIGYLVDHDNLTLELCSDALKSLSENHLGYANQLRHMWTCATPGSRYGFKAKTPIARMLQQHDRSSALALKAVQ